MLNGLYVIDIGIEHLVVSSPVAISWHGVFSAVGIAVAVLLALKPGYRIIHEYKLKPDVVTNFVIVIIVTGLVCARIVHVVDNWDIYENNFISVLYVWNGGIGLWGGILGAYLGGVIYAYFGKVPWQAFNKIADVCAIPALAGQTVGRVGDIINGEHCATASDLPWAFLYSNPSSPGYSCVIRNGLGDPATTSVHPAILYEMIWNVIGIGILFLLRNRIKPDGGLFLIYLLWYSIGRFAIQWVRLDPVYLLGLQEAHLISIAVAFVTVWLIIGKVRLKKADPKNKEAAG